jgi:hypothetical protein
MSTRSSHRIFQLTNVSFYFILKGRRCSKHIDTYFVYLVIENYNEILVVKGWHSQNDILGFYCFHTNESTTSLELRAYNSIYSHAYIEQTEKEGQLQAWKMIVEGWDRRNFSSIKRREETISFLYNAVYTHYYNC